MAELAARRGHVDVVNHEGLSIVNDLVTRRNRTTVPFGFVENLRLLNQIAADQAKFAVGGDVEIGKALRVFHPTVAGILKRDDGWLLGIEKGKELLAISLTDIVGDDGQRFRIRRRTGVPTESHISEGDERCASAMPPKQAWTHHE